MAVGGYAGVPEERREPHRLEAHLQADVEGPPHGAGRHPARQQERRRRPGHAADRAQARLPQELQERKIGERIRLDRVAADGRGQLAEPAVAGETPVDEGVEDTTGGVYRRPTVVGLDGHREPPLA
nr:hypothetical protein GCM10020092_089690 [Actinoplanes digitatis]